MKVSGYGDMLSQVKGLPCIAFVMFGSYQGDWVGVLDNGTEYELWKGYYGSCSGCDFLEAQDSDYPRDARYIVKDEDAKDYFKEDNSFINIPKELFKTMTLKQFEEILPANIRDIYEFNVKELFNAISTPHRVG